MTIDEIGETISRIYDSGQMEPISRELVRKEPEGWCGCAAAALGMALGIDPHHMAIEAENDQFGWIYGQIAERAGISPADLEKLVQGFDNYVEGFRDMDNPYFQLGSGLRTKYDPIEDDD